MAEWAVAEAGEEFVLFVPVVEQELVPVAQILEQPQGIHSVVAEAIDGIAVVGVEGIEIVAADVAAALVYMKQQQYDLEESVATQNLAEDLQVHGPLNSCKYRLSEP